MGTRKKSKSREPTHRIEKPPKSTPSHPNQILKFVDRPGKEKKWEPVRKQNEVRSVSAMSAKIPSRSNHRNMLQTPQSNQDLLGVYQTQSSRGTRHNSGMDHLKSEHRPHEQYFAKNGQRQRARSYNNKSSPTRVDLRASSNLLKSLRI